MRDGAPRRRAARPAGRRNLSAVAEAAGMPAGCRVTKHEKGDRCDRTWLERREVRDRGRPRRGTGGHVNGHYRRRAWHVPLGGGAQLAPMPGQAGPRCPGCGKCWSDGHDGPVSDAGRHMTARLADTIHDGLMLRKGAREHMAEHGPSRHLVSKVVESAFVDWQHVPHTPCVDGSEADTDAGKMAVGACDGDVGRVIKAPPGMGPSAIDRLFGRLAPQGRARVGCLTCDMGPEMVAVRRRWLPKARPCVDRLHVVRLAGKALSDVRRRVGADKATGPAPRRGLKGSWRLLVSTLLK